MPRMKPIQPYADDLKQVERRLSMTTISPEERIVLRRFRNALFYLAHNPGPQPDAEEELRSAYAELRAVEHT